MTNTCDPFIFTSHFKTGNDQCEYWIASADVHTGTGFRIQEAATIREVNGLASVAPQRLLGDGIVLGCGATPGEALAVAERLAVAPWSVTNGRYE